MSEPIPHGYPGLKPKAICALVLLESHGGLTVKELARKMVLAQFEASNLLRSLDDLDLVCQRGFWPYAWEITYKGKGFTL